MKTIPLARSLLALTVLTAAPFLSAQSPRAAEQSSINRNQGGSSRTRSLTGAEMAAIDAKLNQETSATVLQEMPLN